MFIDDLDPDNDTTTPDNGDSDDGADTSASATDGKSQQSDDKTKTSDTSDNDDDRDWKASYKGLQKASEKKRNALEKQLTKAQSDLETTTTDLETAKSDTGSLESKKTEAEKAKEKLEDEIQTLTTDKESLETQISQQNIVMSEFPQLAPLAKFIPVGNDEESFRTSAAAFNTALEQYVDKGVDASLKGASATFGEGDDDSLSTEDSELDKAWETIYKHGGDPKHQDEVDKANALITEKQPETDI